MFVTHCAPEDVPEVQDWMAKFKAAASGGTLMGFFDCQGELSKALELVMRLSTKKESRFFAKNHNSKGQPDESRLLRAKAFARETMDRMASA